MIGSAATPRAWLLNLDAELELRRPTRYQPTLASLRACRHFEPFARGLVGPADLVLSREAPVDGLARGFVGVAWCPTPSALAALERAGATVAPAPPLTCLQRVNHRRFHAGLGQVLDGAQFVEDTDQARQQLLQPRTDGWMVKRGFGFAGRSNRRFPACPSPDDWRWLEHAFLDGGVQIEPWLVILEEYSLHGELARNGATRLGTPCVRLRRDVPAYALAPHDALGAAEGAALYAQAQYASRALHEAGYWGPFGIDAFRYQTSTGPRFNARSEINARHTLAYAIGMARVPD